MESLPNVRTTAIAAGLGCLALLVALLGGADAEAKKKKKAGGYVATVTLQSEILDKGVIHIRGKGAGKVNVHAMAGNSSQGSIGTAKLKKPGKKGKSVVRKVKLNQRGRTLLSGCTITGLSTRTVISKKKGKKKKGKKKKGKKVRRNKKSKIERDLAVCSVGSENPTARPYKGPEIPTPNSDRCDFLDPTVCLQPFPNDYFTTADPGTDTGRRLNLNQASMPQNRNGVPIDASDYRRSDGFSPGNLIVVKIPQVQTQTAFNNSGLVPINDLHRFGDANQPVVVIDAATGQRHPIWAEVDVNPLVPGNSGNVADSNLIIRPARNFEEGHRYIVALRNLRDASNDPVPPPMPFRVYRDRLITQQAPIESRRTHVENLISTLQGDGIPRANLYMAWDFTVASEESLAGRALKTRDDALLRIGDDTPGDPIDGDETGDDTPGDGVVDGDAPQFSVASVTDFPPGGRLARQVDGFLTNVPCYLNSAGCTTGGTFTFASGQDLPTTQPTQFADDDGAGPNPGVAFRCIIPSSVDAGDEVDPALAATYGHGLLGLHTQVNGQARLANQQNSVWCATNWAGFSTEDISTVISSLSDLSNFRRLVDRMQQGFVNFHYLGRAMIHPDGFNSDDAFKVDADESATLDADESVIDNSNLYFEGISQGAIMGGSLTALSPDIKRSVLNVNGMNYSTLLRRSVDFDEYAELPNLGLYDNYPNELERPLILSLMQLLWDRGETNGYAHHMTDDPLANTPSHDVLMQAAFGDHQVANITAEVQARTMGASLYKPALDPGRHWEANPFLGLPGIDFGPGLNQPFGGSALVYYDGGPETYENDGVGENALECTNNEMNTVPLSNPCQGSKTPPNEEVPPRPENGFGEDPHGYPRRAVDGLLHIEQWLPIGGGILPCMDGPAIRPCYANGWTGP